MPERDLLRLEYVPLSQVVLWERNPKQHDIGAIAGANAYRRAIIATLFGDAVMCDVVSVRRVPARTVRRKLRI